MRQIGRLLGCGQIKRLKPNDWARKQTWDNRVNEWLHLINSVL